MLSEKNTCERKIKITKNLTKISLINLEPNYFAIFYIMNSSNLMYLHDGYNFKIIISSKVVKKR